MALDGARTAAGDFAPIDSLSRELRAGAMFEDSGTLALELDAVPAAVQRLVLVAFAEPGGERSFPPAGLAVVGDGRRFQPDLTGRRDAAVLLVEIYRHGGGWRLAANGQGFAEGLAAVARSVRLDPGWARRFEPSTQPPYPPSPPPLPSPSRSGHATGSGVAVGPHHVLSNAHVVADARTIAVSGDAGTASAECVFANPRNDLALLRVERPMPEVARFRPGLDLHLGEDIMVLGFPLQGLLGTGPQASAGNVAALTGVGNDCSMFQFTAPIASGNSGGPVVDLSGHVVGLVCASLDLDHVRRAGASAENVNFGVKAAMIRSFLDAFWLAATLAGDEPPLGRAAVVRRMRGVIHRIACAC